MEATNQRLLIDRAITSENEDFFNFKHYAKKVDLIIKQSLSNPEPITIGIYGKWGEGKTSFLNLLESYLKDSSVILKYHFNPWRYSNEDEMLFDFFQGLSKTLLLKEDQKLKKAGKYILRFSRYLKAIKLSATIGIPKATNTKITFEPSEIFKALGEDLIGEELSLENFKNKIDTELEYSDYKVAIFIDDIDRLDKEEIYTLLKIIKLNANFKNLIYFVSLDSEQVAKAIHNRYGKNKIDGKLFLEKIINIPILLPRIEQKDLKHFFENKLAIIIQNLNLKDKDEDYKEILDSFHINNFSSPREIIRTLNSFYINAFSIGKEVNLHDLFWIEYLKVSDEKCFNYIKKYTLNTLWTYEFEEILDFNDDFQKNKSDEFPNGSRKYLLETFTNSKNLLEYLFPIKQKNQSILSQGPDSQKLKNELRVNTYDHFEKYFSLNPIGKISEENLKNLKQKIAEKDFKESEILLKELFNNNDELAYKTLYRIKELINHIESRDIKNSFFLFLVDNIDLIPSFKKDMFSRDEHNILVEGFAKTLNEEINDNTNIILEIANKLNVENLCFFTRKIDKNSLIKKELEKLIIEKTKEEYSDTSPFYETPEAPYNKMIIQVWKELNPEELNNYIKETINKNNIGNLIRNFPTFWNNSYFGSLTSENFRFMNKLLNIDFIYEKLKEYYPEIIEEKISQEEKMKWSDTNESTSMDNMKQFITLYKKNSDTTHLD